MPTIEEVTDETFEAQLKRAADEEEWDDEDSEILSDSDSEEDVEERGLSIREESILDRIYALRDIVSPSTRRSISLRARQTYAYLAFGGRLTGNLLWCLTTSALLVGLPYALAVENESKIMQHEKELMAQQQGQQMLGGGSNPYAPQQPAGGAPGGQGLRPPGF